LVSLAPKPINRPIPSFKTMRVRFYIRSPHPEVFKFVTYGLTYCAGVLLLSVLTLGQIEFASLWTIHERNENKKWWNDWSIWLHRPEQRFLRAETICFVGLLFWLAAGFTFHFLRRSS
jgi:hypothetical protein